MNPILFGIVFGAIMIYMIVDVITMKPQNKETNNTKKNMTKEEIINSLITEFTEDFHREENEKGLKANELTDDIISNILKEFFNQTTLTEAEKYLYKAFDQYVEDPYEKINWDLGREAAKETPEYKAWVRHSDLSSIWYDCRRRNKVSEKWVEVNGKAHTADEAAKIAADKWCELIFGWHLQDNGALNESHGGGFPACALATVLANDSKEELTEEMKVKAHELFTEYYKRLIHFNETADMDDINWLKTALKSKDGEFDWTYGFSYDLYCDYDPSWALYLILENAGIPERHIRNICPWKTGISIRTEDNAVMYKTYQHCDEI